MDRYRRGASFPYINVSLIRYGLRAISNLLNRRILFFKFFQIFGTVFAPVFELFVETRRVIRRWKAMDKAQLSYVELVFRFLAVFKLILKIVRRTTSGSGRFSRNFCKPLVGMIQTIRRCKDINDMQLFHVEHSL